MSIPKNPLPPGITGPLPHGISGSTPRRTRVDPATNVSSLTEYYERPRRSPGQRRADAEALAEFERSQAEHAAQAAAAAARLAAADEAEHAAVFEAARVLGAKVTEILDVRTTALGIEVRMVGAGPVKVLVSPESPDADGRHGILLHPDTPAWQAGERLPVYARTPTLPEVELEPEPEVEPVREPWQDALDEDARLQGLLAEVAEIDAQFDGLSEAARNSGVGPLLREARGPLAELVRLREGRVRSAWMNANPEPPDPDQVKFWSELFVAGTLFDRARSDFERRAVFAAFPAMGPYLNGNAGAVVEAAGAVHWLEGNGIPVPDLPSIDELAAGAS